MSGTGGPSTLRLGLAAARNAPTVEERLDVVERFLEDAGAQGVVIVCFPETYIPGLRGQDFPVPPIDQRRQERALERVRTAAGRRGVHIDWKRHARTGVPVTLATMAISWTYLWFRVLH